MSTWVETVSLVGAVLAGVSVYVGVTNLVARWNSSLRWLGVHVFLLGASYVILILGTLLDLRAAKSFDWRHVTYPVTYIVGMVGLWRLRKRRFRRDTSSGR